MKNQKTAIEIPDLILQKWQTIVEVMAQMIHVPVALIMRVKPPYIEVFRTNASDGNPFAVGNRYDLCGLYCERVISDRERLLVPNALADREWDSNPDLEYGMVSYLGYPIEWPDGEVFGTICVSDTRENHYDDMVDSLILRFKELCDGHLAMLMENAERIEKERLASLMELAGAMAHELNQPIQGILGRVEFLEMEMDGNEAAGEEIDEIRNQIYRMTGILKKLQGLTQYRTKDYLHEKIVDIEQSSL